jgi:UPF0755 protein
LKKIFIVFVLLILAAVGGFGYWLNQPILAQEPEINFIIKPGSSVRSVARQIREAGVPLNAPLFEALVRLSGRARQIKAGPFEVEVGDNPLRILEKMANGEFSQTSLIVIEGWTFQQMRKAIDAQPNLKHDTANLSEQELMEKLGSPYPHAEGLFFPDTYLFAKGSSDLLLYQQAYQAMLRRLTQEWNKHSSNLPYQTAYEALTMASIIEKETAQASERNMVAAVFVNRLKRGMLLQTDPTVIYGMGDQYAGKIHKRDLQTDTPYNTYTRIGLPPTPISLPGQASITAALAPAQSKALYFVARGDGSSQFSDNLDEHNRAVNKYQR